MPCSIIDKGAIPLTRCNNALAIRPPRTHTRLGGPNRIAVVRTPATRQLQSPTRSASVSFHGSVVSPATCGHRRSSPRQEDPFPLGLLCPFFRTDVIQTCTPRTVTQVVVQFLKVAACSTGLARSAAVVAYIMIAHGLQWADAANLHPETRAGTRSWGHSHGPGGILGIL